MILADEILRQTPNTRLVAIHNIKQDGTGTNMNFELSNGYVTKQTNDTTAHRHVIPGAVFTHTTQVKVHHSDRDGDVNIIWGFRFYDA